jgi:hypothetical protein
MANEIKMLQELELDPAERQSIDTIARKYRARLLELRHPNRTKAPKLLCPVCQRYGRARFEYLAKHIPFLEAAAAFARGSRSVFQWNKALVTMFPNISPGYSTARHHGLITNLDVNDKPMLRGFWRVTIRGYEVLRQARNETLNRKAGVYIFNNKVIGRRSGL